MKQETDGASIPTLLREYILCNYGPEIMYRIDRAGDFHDILTNKYPNTTAHNRRRFIKQLTRYRIPRELVVIIHIGLYLYDHMPTRLATWVKQILL